MTEYFKKVKLPDGSVYDVLDAGAARENHSHEEYLTQTAADNRYMLNGSDLSDSYLTKTAADGYYADKNHGHTISTTTDNGITELTTTSVNVVTGNSTVTAVTSISTSTASIGVVTGVSTTTGNASYITGWNAGDAPIKSVSTAALTEIKPYTSLTTASITSVQVTSTPMTTVTGVTTTSQTVVTGIGVTPFPEGSFITSISGGTNTVSDGVLVLNNIGWNAHVFDPVPYFIQAGTNGANITIASINKITNVQTGSVDKVTVTTTATTVVTTGSTSTYRVFPSTVTIGATGGVVGSKPTLTYNTVTPIFGVSTTAGMQSIITGVSTTTAQTSKITHAAQTVVTGPKATVTFVKTATI